MVTVCLQSSALATRGRPSLMTTGRRSKEGVCCVLVSSGHRLPCVPVCAHMYTLTQIHLAFIFTVLQARKQLLSFRSA